MDFINRLPQRVAVDVLKAALDQVPIRLISKVLLDAIVVITLLPLGSKHLHCKPKSWSLMSGSLRLSLVAMVLSLGFRKLWWRQVRSCYVFYRHFYFFH